MDEVHHMPLDMGEAELHRKSEYSVTPCTLATVGYMIKEYLPLTVG